MKVECCYCGHDSQVIGTVLDDDEALLQSYLLTCLDCRHRSLGDPVEPCDVKATKKVLLKYEIELR